MNKYTFDVPKPDDAFNWHTFSRPFYDLTRWRMMNYYVKKTDSVCYYENLIMCPIHGRFYSTKCLLLSTLFPFSPMASETMPSRTEDTFMGSEDINDGNNAGASNIENPRYRFENNSSNELYGNLFNAGIKIIPEFQRRPHPVLDYYLDKELPGPSTRNDSSVNNFRYQNNSDTDEEDVSTRNYQFGNNSSLNDFSFSRNFSAPPIFPLGNLPNSNSSFRPNNVTPEGSSNRTVNITKQVRSAYQDGPNSIKQNVVYGTFSNPNNRNSSEPVMSFKSIIRSCIQPGLSTLPDNLTTETFGSGLFGDSLNPIDPDNIGFTNYFGSDMFSNSSLPEWSSNTRQNNTTYSDGAEDIDSNQNIGNDFLAEDTSTGMAHDRPTEENPSSVSNDFFSEETSTITTNDFSNQEDNDVLSNSLSSGGTLIGSAVELSTKAESNRLTEDFSNAETLVRSTNHFRSGDDFNRNSNEFATEGTSIGSADDFSAEGGFIRKTNDFSTNVISIDLTDESLVEESFNSRADNYTIAGPSTKGRSNKTANKRSTKKSFKRQVIPPETKQFEDDAYKSLAIDRCSGGMTYDFSPEGTLIKMNNDSFIQKNLKRKIQGFSNPHINKMPKNVFSQDVGNIMTNKGSSVKYPMESISSTIGNFSLNKNRSETYTGNRTDYSSMQGNLNVRSIAVRYGSELSRNRLRALGLRGNNVCNYSFGNQSTTTQDFSTKQNPKVEMGTCSSNSLLRNILTADLPNTIADVSVSEHSTNTIDDNNVFNSIPLAFGNMPVQAENDIITNDMEIPSPLLDPATDEFLNDITEVIQETLLREGFSMDILNVPPIGVNPGIEMTGNSSENIVDDTVGIFVRGNSSDINTNNDNKSTGENIPDSSVNIIGGDPTNESFPDKITD